MAEQGRDLHTCVFSTYWLYFDVSKSQKNTVAGLGTSQDGLHDHVNAVMM